MNPARQHASQILRNARDAFLLETKTNRLLGKLGRMLFAIEALFFRVGADLSVLDQGAGRFVGVGANSQGIHREDEEKRLLEAWG
jgi:hypothetical protein